MSKSVKKCQNKLSTKNLVMKTAREIATEYLKEFDRYYLPEQIDELTKEIELYAHEQVKLFTIHNVRQQRELLIAYENKVGHMDKDEAIKFVDEYLNKLSTKNLVI